MFARRCLFAILPTARWSQNKGVLQVYSGVEFANFQRAEDEILAQLKACQNGQIDQGELEAARRSMISNLRTTQDSQGRLEEYWLNRFCDWDELCAGRTGSSLGPSHFRPSDSDSARRPVRQRIHPTE